MVKWWWFSKTEVGSTGISLHLLSQEFQSSEILIKVILDSVPKSRYKPKPRCNSKSTSRWHSTSIPETEYEIEEMLSTNQENVLVQT